ncbi:LPXTG cell wall anchor domain-containing protein [Corynebacterium sp. TAE3-ERU16]|uniref:LPXTG cell wall anchor domain-containing protein n=1 Tax=Corynebacterium sp. TAE3-ERU16 TaxID=2849493 RepID=UPI001C46DA18|nr:LPXTG cell wall anchor domain-containing protein [Corynebacterium sp. TAE3-ERU16]MBV7292856.1 LPXTG cell wall anchor domain-containing protein [Corynebacterium sp. TAE3-ERU16]
MQKRWMIPVSVMMVLAGSVVSPAAAEDEVPTGGAEATVEQRSEVESEPTPSEEGPEVRQAPLTFRVVDSATGQAREGAKYDVSFKDVSGEISDLGSFEVSGSGISLQDRLPDGVGWDQKKDDGATTQLILKENTAAPGCTANETPIVLQPTSPTDWEIVSGPEGVSVSEGRIVEYRSSCEAGVGVGVKKFVESLPEGDGQKGTDPVHVAGDSVEVRYRVSVPELSDEALTMLELVDSNIDFTVEGTVVQTADRDTAVVDEPLTCTVDKAASGQASYLDGAEFTVEGSRFTEDGVNKAKFEFPEELSVAPGQAVNCVSVIDRLGSYHADMAAVTSNGKVTNALMEAHDPLFLIRQESADDALLSGGALLGAALGSSLLGSSGSSAPGASGNAGDSPVSPEAAAPAPAAPSTDQAPDSGEKSGVLASTGADVVGLLAAGLLALVIGALLVFMRRQRS